MTNIPEYKLPDEVENYSYTEKIKAFEEGNEGLKKIEEYLEKNNLNIFDILDSKFELIGYDEKLMNKIIQYYLYLKIIEENNYEKEQKLLEENDEKNIEKIYQLKKIKKGNICDEKNKESFTKYVNDLTDNGFKLLLENDKKYKKLFNYINSIEIDIIKYIYIEIHFDVEKMDYFNKKIFNNPNHPILLIEKIMSYENLNSFKEGEKDFYNIDFTKKNIENFNKVFY